MWTRRRLPTWSTWLKLRVNILLQNTLKRYEIECYSAIWYMMNTCSKTFLDGLQDSILQRIWYYLGSKIRTMVHDLVRHAVSLKKLQHGWLNTENLQNTNMTEIQRRNSGCRAIHSNSLGGSVPFWSFHSRKHSSITTHSHRHAEMLAAGLYTAGVLNDIVINDNRRWTFLPVLFSCKSP